MRRAITCSTQPSGCGGLVTFHLIYLVGRLDKVMDWVALK